MFKMGLMRVFSSLIPAIVLAIAMERKKKKRNIYDHLQC